jgi:hypothetical protein
MSYSTLTKRDLKKLFGVEEVFRSNLFTDIQPRQVSDWLETGLRQNFDFALAQGTEKARSEFLIALVFAELKQQVQDKASIFSGWEFNVDVEKGLTERCDFLVFRSSYQAEMESPIVVTVEAKEEDFNKGITQCTAEMIAARIFNEREGNPTNQVYGCVTTGDVWRFLILRGNRSEIDSKPFDLRDDIETIFGLLWAMTFDEITWKNGEHN